MDFQCSIEPLCMEVLRENLDQFWNLSLSTAEAEKLNLEYSQEEEESKLPTFLKKVIGKK